MHKCPEVQAREITVKVWVNYSEGTIEEVFPPNVTEKRTTWGEWEYDDELLEHKLSKICYIKNYDSLL